jgi:hypothetical protein
MLEKGLPSIISQAIHDAPRAKEATEPAMSEEDANGNGGNSGGLATA